MNFCNEQLLQRVTSEFCNEQRVIFATRNERILQRVTSKFCNEQQVILQRVTSNEQRVKSCDSF